MQDRLQQVDDVREHVFAVAPTVRVVLDAALCARRPRRRRQPADQDRDAAIAASANQRAEVFPVRLGEVGFDGVPVLLAEVEDAGDSPALVPWLW